MPVDRMTKLFAKFQLIIRQFVNIHLRQHTFQSCICLQKSLLSLYHILIEFAHHAIGPPANDGVS